MRGVAGEARAIAALCLFWIVAVLAVNPAGDFAMVDDWAYAPSVTAFLAGDGITFSDWAAGNLVSHILWGSAFGAVFGPTPTVLRISTLTAGLLGAIALYRLFRLAKVERGLALLGAGIGVFNPLYFSLAFSFMTDVTYTAMQLVAMWLVAGGILARKPVVQALGWAVGVAALLCRQLGLFIPFGLIGEALVRRPWRLRNVILALVPVALFFVVQWAFQYWLAASGKESAYYGRQIHEMTGSLLRDPAALVMGAVKLPAHCFFYLGLFCLPLSLCCVPGWLPLLPERARRWAPPLLVIAAIGICLGSLAAGWAFPMWRDTLNLYSGLGVEDMGTPLPNWALWVLTAAASLGGLLLVAGLAGAAVTLARAPRDQFSIAVFAATTGLCLLAPVALIELRFDRYLAPILPCALLALSPLLAGRTPPRAIVGAAVVALAAMAVCAIGGTHDYLQAKRVQWRVYGDLLKTVPAGRIDAGWVVNGAMSFGKYGTSYDVDSWYERADYRVGASLTPEYVVISEHPVRRWLPWNASGRPIIVSKPIAGVPVEHRSEDGAQGPAHNR